MKRHDLDPVSLIAGLMFVAIAVLYGVAQLTDAHVRWLVALPIGLLVMGAAMLALTARRIRSSTAGDDTPNETGGVIMGG